MRSDLGSLQTTLLQLALNRSAIGLRSPAAKILYVETCHGSIVTRSKQNLARAPGADNRLGYFAALGWVCAGSVGSLKYASLSCGSMEFLSDCMASLIRND